MRKSFSSLAAASVLLLGSALAQSCYVRISEKAQTKIIEDMPLAGSEELGAKTFSPGAFSGIAVSGSFDVEFIPSEGEPRVELTTSKNLLEYAYATVRPLGETEDSVLRVGFDLPSYSVRECKAVIYAPSISSIHKSGSGDLRLKGGLVCDSLYANFYGSGDFQADSLQAEGEVKVFKSGSGDVSLAGLKADGVKIVKSGTGDMELKGLNAGKLELESLGSGSIELSGQVQDFILNKGGSGRLDAKELVIKGEYRPSISGTGSVKTSTR